MRAPRRPASDRPATQLTSDVADFALELSFDDDGDRAVRESWQALRFLGLPSQADHRGVTNAPHLSLVVARAIPDDVRLRAAELLAPLLPAVLELRGIVVIGRGARVTLALLAEPEPPVVDAVTQLRALTPAVRHPVWTPHVTLGRRIPRDRIGEAIAGVHDAPTCVTGTRLRWWDPDAGTIDVLAGA